MLLLPVLLVATAMAAFAAPPLLRARAYRELAAFAAVLAAALVTAAVVALGGDLSLVVTVPSRVFGPALQAVYRWLGG